MASGPHTFVTMVVFSATKFEGSRHVVLTPHGPPDHPPLNPNRKARHANEFGLSTVYIYDIPSPPPPPPLPTSSPAQQQPPPLLLAQTLRRLESFRPFSPGKGIYGFPIGEVAFEAGAVLAAAHYLCTYVERSSGGASLPRAGEEREQRISFWLPRLQKQQRVLLEGRSGEGAAAAADGRVNVMFNTYRQVAAVAIPSVSTMFRIHKKKVPLKVTLESQPQVKIVPDYEKLYVSSGKEAGPEQKKEKEEKEEEGQVWCPIVSLGTDMHFILIDLTAAPTILPALTASTSPSSTTAIEKEVELDDVPGWGSSALKSSILGMIWFVRGNKDVVKGEATIENLKCRVFTFTGRGGGGVVEEEGLGNTAAVVGAYLSLLDEENEESGSGSGGRVAGDREGEKGKGRVVQAMQNLHVSSSSSSSSSSSTTVANENKDAPEAFGADITPTPTHTQPPKQSTTTSTSTSFLPPSLPSEPPQQKTQRRVYGISTAVEMGRNSMIAVEVDVVVAAEDVGAGRGRRRLGGVVVSGRANFQARGEILGS